jgi:hypothetical protein
MTACPCGIRHPYSCCAVCGEAQGQLDHAAYDCARGQMTGWNPRFWIGKWLVPVVCWNCLPALYKNRMKLAVYGRL